MRISRVSVASCQLYPASHSLTVKPQLAISSDGEPMPPAYKKFSSQVAPDKLEAMQDLARKEGRQFS